MSGFRLGGQQSLFSTPDDLAEVNALLRPIIAHNTKLKNQEKSM
jgi:hypothetical protein